MKIFFDGGCRPNPGPMETAVVAGGVADHRPSVGHGTSLEAEWLALFHALDVAHQRGVRDVILLGDAAQLVALASGRAKARSERDRDRVERFREAARGFDRVRLRHVKRTQNLAGIALAGRDRCPSPRGTQ